MNLAQIIKKPVLTEKSLTDASHSIFTFIVDQNANKDQIAQAIQDIYNVEVLNVRTTTVKGKSYRVGRTRITRNKPTQKKARVQLKSGQKIDVFDIESQE